MYQLFKYIFVILAFIWLSVASAESSQGTH